MLLVSQNVNTIKFPIPFHAVLRINAAWVKSADDLKKIVKNIRHDIFLDFPEGRSKPPRPTLSLEDLIPVMKKFTNIKYFAITNTENPEQIIKIREKVPIQIQLIPKIESKTGIDNIEQIINELEDKEKFLMLDKEDLYTDLQYDQELFEKYLNKVRKQVFKLKKTLLELQGVIFSPKDNF